MSKTTNPETITSVAVVPDETPEVVEKQSIAKRVVSKIKKHPKTATAVAAGVSLIALAAYAGRSQQTDTTEDFVTDDEMLVLVPSDVLEEIEATTAE